MYESVSEKTSTRTRAPLRHLPNNYCYSLRYPPLPAFSTTCLATDLRTHDKKTNHISSKREEVRRVITGWLCYQTARCATVRDGVLGIHVANSCEGLHPITKCTHAVTYAPVSPMCVRVSIVPRYEYANANRWNMTDHCLLLLA